MKMHFKWYFRSLLRLLPIRLYTYEQKNKAYLEQLKFKIVALFLLVDVFTFCSVKR